RAAHGQVDVDVRVDEFGAFDEGDPASEVVDDGFGGAQDGGGGAPDDLGPGLLDDVRGVEGLDRGHDLRVEAGGQTGEGEPGQRRGVESVGVDDVDVLVVLVKSEGGVRIGHREGSACCAYVVAELIVQFLGEPERAGSGRVAG